MTSFCSRLVRLVIVEIVLQALERGAILVGVLGLGDGADERGDERRERPVTTCLKFRQRSAVSRRIPL